MSAAFWLRLRLHQLLKFGVKTLLIVIAFKLARGLLELFQLRIGDN